MPEYLTIGHLTQKELTRIFTKIAIDRITDCWIWIGYQNGHGYGEIHFRGRHELVHRILWAATLSPLPRRSRSGKNQQTPELDHVTCSNPNCVNPSHLDLVPHKINVLRGNGWAARNARKKTCSNGHQVFLAHLNADILSRRCAICYQEARYRARKKYAASARGKEHKREYQRKYRARQRLAQE